MSNNTRTPQPDPRPESKEPRDDRPYEVDTSEDSYYGSIMPREQRKVLKEAGTVKDLEQELELLRYRLRGLLIHKPNKDYLVFKAIELIIRAYSAKVRASGDSQDPDGTAIENFLRDAADNVGLERIPWPSNC